MRTCMMAVWVCGFAPRVALRPISAVEHPDLSVTWTLNGGQSDMPAEVAFDPDTIAPANGPVRTYHPNGKEETIRLESGAGVGAVTKWEPAPGNWSSRPSSPNAAAGQSSKELTRF